MGGAAKVQRVTPAGAVKTPIPFELPLVPRGPDSDTGAGALGAYKGES